MDDEDKIRQIMIACLQKSLQSMVGMLLVVVVNGQAQGATDWSALSVADTVVLEDSVATTSGGLSEAQTVATWPLSAQRQWRLGGLAGGQRGSLPNTSLRYSQAPQSAPTLAAPPAGSSMSARGLGLANWDIGRNNWRYQGDRLGLTLGSTQVDNGSTSQTVLGGFRLGTGTTSGSSWDASLAAGAIDRTSGTEGGDLDYGPMAGQAALSWRPQDVWSVDSSVQAAPGMVNTTLGTQMDAGDLGAFRLGMAHGGMHSVRGWGVQTGYEVRLFDRVDLSFDTGRQSTGYADLGNYAQGPASGTMSRRFSAGMAGPMHGTITGTYESYNDVGGQPHQRFGFNQQFWYSPNLRVGVKAQRETVTGDYDVGLSLSVPIK